MEAEFPQSIQVNNNLIDRRKFLTVFGLGTALSIVPVFGSYAHGEDNSICDTTGETTTIYFLNSNWGTQLYPAPYDHKKCKGKACHFRNSNTFYSSAIDAENARLHICCIAPVQSRTVALSSQDIVDLKNGNNSFDVRKAETLQKLKEIIAVRKCTTPDSITSDMVTSVLSNKVSSASKDVPVTEKAPTASAQGNLPFTGVSSNKTLTLFGAGLAGLGALFAFRSRKKEENSVESADSKSL